MKKVAFIEKGKDGTRGIFYARYRSYDNRFGGYRGGTALHKQYLLPQSFRKISILCKSNEAYLKKSDRSRFHPASLALF